MLETTIFKFVKNRGKFSKGKKTLWKMEKLLIMSNFSFSHSVFKILVLQTPKNKGVFEKGLHSWQYLLYLPC